MTWRGLDVDVEERLQERVVLIAGIAFMGVYWPHGGAYRGVAADVFEY